MVIDSGKPPRDHAFDLLSRLDIGALLGIVPTASGPVEVQDLLETGELDLLSLDGSQTLKCQAREGVLELQFQPARKFPRLIKWQPVTGDDAYAVQAVSLEVKDYETIEGFGFPVLFESRLAFKGGVVSFPAGYVAPGGKTKFTKPDFVQVSSISVEGGSIRFGDPSSEVLALPLLDGHPVRDLKEPQIEKVYYDGDVIPAHTLPYNGHRGRCL